MLDNMHYIVDSHTIMLDKDLPVHRGGYKQQVPGLGRQHPSYCGGHCEGNPSPLRCLVHPCGCVQGLVDVVRPVTVGVQVVDSGMAGVPLRSIPAPVVGSSCLC